MLQAIFTGLLVWYGAVTLFPGALTSDLHDRGMTKAASGYDVMQWADTKLPDEARLLRGHRSVALSPRLFVATDWMRHVGVGTEEFEYYARMMD